MMKTMKKITLILIVFLLIFNQAIILITATQPQDIIKISSPEEFLTFAKNCTLDSFSKNKKVILTKNLDFTNHDFYAVGIFSGEFDGNNFTISGLSLSGNESASGVFRYTNEDTIITNLKVKGNITADADNIGGIVGENSGSIINCSFEGNISANNGVGGITGQNMGKIVNSSSYGSMQGKSSVGGISGENSGTIVNVTNYAKVNTKLIATTSLDIANFNDINSSQLDIADIGGIVGANTGIITSAKNTQDVGYPHVGYNIGGVAGRQSGYITKCENSGNIFGRKDVGGIVGQFEPYVSYIYSMSKLQKLKNEIDILSDMTSSFAHDGRLMNSAVNTKMTELNNSVSDSKKNLSSVINEVETIMDINTTSLNRLSVTMAEVLEGLVPVSQSIQNALEDMDTTVTVVRATYDNFLALTAYLKETGEYATNAMIYLNQTVTALNSATTAGNNAATQLEQAVNLALGGAPISQISPLISLSIQNLKEMMTQLDGAMKFLNLTLDEINKMPSMTDSADEIQQIVNKMNVAFTYLNKAVKDMKEASSIITDLLNKVSQKEELVFTSTTKGYEKATGEFSLSVDEMIQNLEDLNQTTSIHTDGLLNSFDEINKQFNVVLNLIIEIIEDVMYANGYEIFSVDDISYENIDSITSGKVSSCENKGKIDGDIYIGGITGAVSFEVGFDREDDYRINSDRKIATQKGVAVIDNCLNFGDITSKKDGAGGIVGYMDFGFVNECTSCAWVSSTSGDYVGGIAGQSLAKIYSCYSKNTVEGKQYVGGIVGQGKDVNYNVSMSDVRAKKGFVGSIAGQVLEEGEVWYNFYVDNPLGGIDKISYEDKAMPIKHSLLLDKPGLPSIFKQVYVSFIVDDDFYLTVNTAYGSEIKAEDLPLIPEKNNYFAVWEDVNLNEITTDLRVSAVYKPNLTTIASEQKQGEMNVVLVDGNFTDSQTLFVNQLNTEYEEVLMSYEVCVLGDYEKIDRVRYLAPDKVEIVQVKNGDEWINVNAQKQGKYLVFDNPFVSNDKITFRVLVAEDNIYYIWIICGVLLLLLLGLIISIHKRHH